MEEMELGCAAEERKKRPTDEGEDGRVQENADKLVVSSAEEGKKRPRDEGEDGQVQENADKLVVSSSEEGKKRPRVEGEDGEGLPEEENEEKEPVVSSGEDGKKLPTVEGEDGEGVPAQENAEKKLDFSAAEAEPAGEEGKDILSVEASHAEKDEEILADAEVEKEEEAARGESVPASVIDSNAQQVAAIPCEAKVGPKVFTSSMDMFNFFYDLLRAWPLNFNLNKYEHLMLEDLINQGHHEPQKKVGAGIKAFQVRINPDFYSRCYYILRTDGSADDFSYRKCVDNILPLPEEFKSPSGDLKAGNKNMGLGVQHDNRGRGGRGGARRGGGWGGRRGGGGHRRGNRGRGGRF